MCNDSQIPLNMRRKLCKCLLLVLITGIIGICLNLYLDNKTNKQIDTPFHFNQVKDIRPVVYPTKAKSDLKPTRSLDEIRDILFGHGPRVNVDTNDVKMPDKPYGNASYDNDVHLHEQIQYEADILQDVDLNAVPQGLPTIMPKLDGENVVAMTLYGSELRYTMGALKNAELIKNNFPGWKLRIYTETPSENVRYGIVPQTVLDRLRVLRAEIHYIDPHEDWVPPMMWRFLVADDLWVDRFIIRDTDARLTQRDAAAVYAWVKSDKAFHCVRDHPSHASYAVSGGMWGGKPQDLNNILRRSWREMMHGARKDYLEDMNFLNSIIWPKVQHNAYCSDSVSCLQFPASHPFPVPRHGYEHVGQVVSEHDLGRSMDISILKQAGENPDCTPRGYNILGMKVNETETSNL